MALKSGVTFRGADAVTAGHLPDDTQVAAFYADGPYANEEAVKARFPHGVYFVGVATNAFVRARCLDIETGDATPWQAAGWFRDYADRSEGKPIFYCNASTIGSVEEALTQAGISRDDYYEWQSDWDNVAAVPPGRDAAQYAGAVTDPYDSDIWEEYVFVTAPKPKPKPKPPPKPKLGGIAKFEGQVNLVSGVWEISRVAGTAEYAKEAATWKAEVTLEVGGPNKGRWSIKGIALP